MNPRVGTYYVDLEAVFVLESCFRLPLVCQFVGNATIRSATESAGTTFALLELEQFHTFQSTSFRHAMLQLSYSVLDNLSGIQPKSKTFNSPNKIIQE